MRSAAHDAVTKDVATDGAVLLKNDGGALPLAAGADSIAVIGSSASAAPVYAVGGSAYVPPVASVLVTPLQGIQDRAPAGTTINYAQGAAPIGQQPDAPELPLLATPLTATYFGTPDWTGTPVLTQTESGVNLNGGIRIRRSRRAARSRPTAGRSATAAPTTSRPRACTCSRSATGARRSCSSTA